MTKIIKKYPPKFGLQLVRFDDKAPFQCNRCGRAKISSIYAYPIQTPENIICNGCYGRLNSLAKIKISANLSYSEKIDSIHSLIQNEISKRDALNQFQLISNTQKQFIKFLSEPAKQFIGTAEILKNGLNTSFKLDFSPLIIELVKAFEIEVIVSFIDPMKDLLKSKNYDEIEMKTDLIDKDLGKLTKYLLEQSNKPPELGTIAYILQTCLNSTKRLDTSKLIQIVKEKIKLTRNPQFFNKDFCEILNKITRSYRNPAAHTGSIDKLTCESCYTYLIGNEGVFWKYISAR